MLPETWLTLASPSNETLRFSLKGPLYAASAVFSRRSSEGVSIVEARGDANLRIPFMTKNFKYAIDSFAGAPGLFEQNENDHRWLAEEECVRLDEKTSFVSARAECFMPASELIFALNAALRVHPSVSFGAIIPTGKRLQGVSLKQTKMHLYEGRLAKLEAAHERAYLAAAWPPTPQFEIEIQNQSVAAIRFSLKLLGRLELRAKRG